MQLSRGLTKAAVALLVFLAPAASGAEGGGGADGGPAPASTMIPQPRLDALAPVTRKHLAPTSQRVDLAMPTFSNPTRVTNPLFPISDLRSAVLVGKFEGKPWRAETVLLPETRTVEWDGQRIETLQSQFVAFLAGRIYEVAIDLYAQADDGSVWYFGEDAFSYEHGRVSDVSETWHAGTEGPATMIMPGHPRVGDVYRTENIPGLIFEEVTVKEVGATRPGPVGPVQGVMVGRELHMEGDLEDKAFAPGYGELRSGLGEDYEATALAVPADALMEPVPVVLTQLSTGAVQLLDGIDSKDWQVASASTKALQAAYEAYRKLQPPARLSEDLAQALEALAKAAKGPSVHRASLAAIRVARIAAELTLRYCPPSEIDLVRLDLWARQLTADAAAGDEDAVAGDVATLRWLRDRVVLTGADREAVDDRLRFLAAAAEAGNTDAAANAAKRLRETIAAQE